MCCEGSMMEMKVVVLILTLFASTNAEHKREVLGPFYNPDCKHDCNEPWLVYVMADGTNNTLHHLWGTHGAPSFLLANTPLHTDLVVDWEKLQNGNGSSLTFDKLNQVFGFSIPYLILFNDTKDTGALDISEDATYYIPSSDFSWVMNVSSNSNSSSGGVAKVTFHTTAYQGDLLPNDTQIVIKLWGYGEDGRSSELPKLLHTPSSAQVDISLSKFVFDVHNGDESPTSSDNNGISGFSRARWAIQLAILSSEVAEKDDNGVKFHQQRSLDDEHAPGVFHLDEMTTSGKGGYLQWRPVSYMEYKRSINYATNVNINTTITKIPSPLPGPIKASLAYGLLGDALANGDLVTGMTVISFGQKKDGYYTENNYTTWTVGFGEGSPPNETFSTVVIIVISIGLGIPIVLFIVGGVVITTRKCRRNRNSQTILINE